MKPAGWYESADPPVSYREIYPGALGEEGMKFAVRSACGVYAKIIEIYLPM